MFLSVIKMPKGSFIIITLAVVVLTASLIVSFKNEGTKVVSATDDLSVLGYISSFDIEVLKEGLIEDEIKVPVSFDDVYKNYNKIQKDQGFDLESYKGKTLKRYTYPVINIEDETPHFVEVLTFDGIIVAADVYSTSIEGSIRALK